MTEKTAEKVKKVTYDEVSVVISILNRMAWAQVLRVWKESDIRDGICEDSGNCATDHDILEGYEPEQEECGF